MTNAAVAALMGTPGIVNEWLPRILSRKYDSSTEAAGAKRPG